MTSKKPDKIDRACMLVSLGKVKHPKKVSTCMLNSPARKVAATFLEARRMHACGPSS